MPLLTIDTVWKSYQDEGKRTISVLRGASLNVEPGEFVAIYGASGSGKSTLLHIMGGLDAPNRGAVYFNGAPVYMKSEAERARLRNRGVGFVFQFYHLLPEFTAEENVMLPCILGGVPRADARQRAVALLHEVGLRERRSHRPHMLSGGEQQRVAIARALAQSPQVILADEPTGNLDTVMGSQVMELLLRKRIDCGAAMVMVTHNLQLLQHVDRAFELREGLLHAA